MRGLTAVCAVIVTMKAALVAQVPFRSPTWLAPPPTLVLYENVSVLLRFVRPDIYLAPGIEAGASGQAMLETSILPGVALGQDAPVGFRGQPVAAGSGSAARSLGADVD